MTYQLVETKTLGSAQAAIEFTSIPQDATDLLILFSIRSERAGNIDDPLGVRFNGSSSGYTLRATSGNGFGGFVNGGGSDSAIFSGFLPAGATTSNTFHNGSIYIPNYRASTNKTVSVDSVSETDGSNAYASLVAGVWSNSAAIDSVRFLSYQTSSNLSANSSVSLYKITRGSSNGVVVS